MNNGFDQNAVYTLQTSDSALVALNKTTGVLQSTLIAGVSFTTPPYPDAWTSMCFSGTTANTDARLFIAKESPRQLKIVNGYPFDRSPTDLVIREVTANGSRVREVGLASLLGLAQIGPNVRIGSIRYSPYHNSLFISGDTDFKDHGQYARIYELDLGLTMVKNVYLGGQPHQEEANISVNPIDGTIYMTEQYMGMESTTTSNQSSPRGSVVAIDTHTGNVTTIVDGPIMFSTYQPNFGTTGQIDGSQLDWTGPVCPIYRGTFNGTSPARPTLLVTVGGLSVANGGVNNTKQPELYLDQTDTTLDGLAYKGSPFSDSGAVWRGQLDELTGNVLIDVLQGGIIILTPSNTKTTIGGSAGYQDLAIPGKSLTPSTFVPNFTYTAAGKPQIDAGDAHRFSMNGKEWYLTGYYPGLGAMTIEIDSWDSTGIGQGIPMLDSRKLMHNKMAANGINYYRAVFTEGQSVGAPANKVLNPSQETLPYVRSSTTGAADGGNMFDLNTWNQSHFDYWKNVLADAQSKGIVLQLCVFDSWHLNQFTRPGGDPYGLKYDFYAANMNINGCTAANENQWHTVDPTPLNDADDAPIMLQQKRLVRKTVDELAGYPNIIWEIINEPRPYYDGNDNYGPPASDPNANAWAMQMATYLKNYEQSSRGSTHVTMPIDLPDHQHTAGQRPDLLMTQVVETDSQTATGTHRDMIKQFNLDHTFSYWPQTAQPIVADNDAPGSESMTYLDRGQKAWGSLTAGGYSSWFHSNMDILDLDVNYGMWYAGMARRFHEGLSVQLSGMTPHDDLVTNSKWCVARPTHEFVVYFRSGGSTTISQLPASRVVNKWFDAYTGAISNAPSSGTTFTAPTSGDWALYISDVDHSITGSPPAITQQPTNQIVATGGTANFTVTASGTAPLTYQWQKNSVNVANGGHVSGATTSTLTISTADSTDVATYRCVVTNALGSATSNGAYLSVTVAQSPFGGTARAIPGTIQAEDYDLGGESVSYHDTTLGTNFGTSTYRNDNDVDVGSCGDGVGCLNVGWIDPAEWLEYTVNVATTATYIVSVRAATANPTASTYHLEVDGVNVSGTQTVNNTGGWDTWTTLTFNVNLTAGNGRILRLSFDTGAWNANYVQFALVNPPPTITAQPQNVSNAIPGSTVQFSVTASGTGLSYQWRKGTTNLVNGGKITGATTATLTITGVDNSDEATNYNCVVTNTGGSVTSNNASLTVLDPPTVTAQPSNEIIASGSNANFSVTASSAVTPTYQWQKNAVNLTNGGKISGATSATLTITGVALSDNAGYACVVTNGAGSVTSNTATLSVTTAQGPFGGTARAIPGTIQAEDYDLGGQTVSYNDTTLDTNFGGSAYRADNQVDVGTCGDGAGCLMIGWIADTEWLEYTVNVTATANYDIKVRVASAAPTAATYHIEINGVDITGARNVASTGGWDTWTTLTIPSVALTAGNGKIMKLAFDAGSWNVNWIQFVQLASTLTYSDAFTANSANLNGRTIEVGGVTWAGSSMQVTGGEAIPIAGNWRVKGDIPINTSTATTISVQVVMRDHVSGSMFLGMPGTSLGDIDATGGSLYLEVPRAGDYSIKSIVGGAPNTIFSGGTIPGWVINSTHTFEFMYNVSAKTVTIKMDGSALVSNVSIGTYTPTLGRAGFQGRRLNNTQTFGTADIDFDNFVVTVN